MTYFKQNKNVILSLSSYVILALVMSALTRGSYPLPIELFLVIVSLISAVLGIFFAVRSVKLKESPRAGTFLKIIGIVVLVCIVLLYAFVIFIDVIY
jgi:hypothetical protein